MADPLAVAAVLQDRVSFRDKVFKIVISLCKIILDRFTKKPLRDAKRIAHVDRLRTLLKSLDDARVVMRLGGWVSGLQRVRLFDGRGISGSHRDLRVIATFISLACGLIYNCLNNVHWLSRTILPALASPKLQRRENQVQSLGNGCLLLLDGLQWAKFYATTCPSGGPTTTTTTTVITAASPDAHRVSSSALVGPSASSATITTTTTTSPQPPPFPYDLARSTIIHACDFATEMRWLHAYPLSQMQTSFLSFVSAALTVHGIVTSAGKV